MEIKVYKRTDFKTDEYKDILGLYDLFLEYYKSLPPAVKTNFDLGLTLMVNKDYFRKHKRSSIKWNLEIIPEIIGFIYHLNEMSKAIKIDEFISYDKLSKTILDYSDNNLKSKGEEINSYEKSLTDNLFYIMNDFFVYITSKEEINKNIDHSKHREITNIQLRANSKIKITTHEIKKQTKLINLKANHKPTSNIIKKIFNNLIIFGYVNKTQKLLLIKVFIGFEIERAEKIIWKKNLGELSYFLRLLKDKKIIDYENIKDVCNISSQFFINKKSESISGEQIFKSRPPNKESKAKIDRLFN
jgi:hypothetical protein